MKTVMFREDCRNCEHRIFKLGKDWGETATYTAYCNGAKELRKFKGKTVKKCADMRLIRRDVPLCSPMPKSTDWKNQKSRMRHDLHLNEEK